MDITANTLEELLLTAGQSVALSLDAGLRITRTAHAALLQEWCEHGARPLPADDSLRATLGALLPATHAATLLQRIVAARDAGQSTADLGTIALHNVHGGAERRLTVGLHRAGEPAGGAWWLLLRDVSTSEDLRQALTETREALQTAMAALRAQPGNLRLFLGSAMASVSAIRATLRMPARDQTALGEKLARLHAATSQLGGEARAAQLDPVALACQRFTDRIAILQQQEDCSGDALLPLAVLLDHIARAVGNAWRTEQQRYQEPAATQSPSRPRHAGRQRQSGDWAKASERRWSGFLRKRGEEIGTLVRFRIDGAQLVAPGQRRNVDELLQHLLHNAVDHGIETPEERLAAQKPATGQVSVKFEEAAGALRMTVRDDGRGFDVGRIGRAAVRCGLVSEESLLERDAVDVVGLVFKPTFTTEGLEGDSGRGRGMTFLRKAIIRLGGQISVATKPGRYTQFNIQLPATPAAGNPQPAYTALSE